MQNKTFVRSGDEGRNCTGYGAGGPANSHSYWLKNIIQKVPGQQHGILPFSFIGGTLSRLAHSAQQTRTIRKAPVVRYFTRQGAIFWFREEYKSQIKIQFSGQSLLFVEQQILVFHLGSSCET